MTNSKPADVAEATGTDPRLEIIADVLHGLIPGAVPANLTVHIEEQLPAGQNHSWVGPVEAISAKILDALAATPRGLAEQIAALTAHLTTTPIPAPDRAAVLTQIAESQQHLFDALLGISLAVADEHHGSTADDVVAAADEAGCLAGHSRDACHDAAQAAEDLIAAHPAQNGDTR